MGATFVHEEEAGKFFWEKHYCPGQVNYKVVRHTRMHWFEANDYATSQGGRLPYFDELQRIISQNFHGTIKDGNGGFIDIGALSDQ